MTEKILIVDDDNETIEFLNLILSRQGYQTVTAMSGMHALELAHSENPDLIVLDVMMPDLDGYEVARSLRRHPETALTPILMFTAKIQLEDKVAGYESGVDIYLTKPVHPVELQANIKALISQTRARDKALTEHGYMVGVTSAKGGLGVSTVALNLAIAYHQKHDQRVIAAELRPGQGSWAIGLDFRNPTGLSNLLSLSPTEITQSAVEDQLIPTKYGIDLLLASNDTKDVVHVTAIAQFEVIIQQLFLLAPFVVLDIGTNILPAYELVTDLCNEIILVTEPQPMSVKRSRVLVDELRSKGFGSSKVLTMVIVNHTRADMVLSMSQIEETVGHSVALGIPPSPELAYQAAEQSAPMCLIRTDGLFAQQFNQLAELIAHRVPK